MLDTTPSVTTAAVTVERGATRTTRRIRAAIRPLRSARPMPIIATTMMPTGPKLTKFGTTDVITNRMPAGASRLLTWVVACSTRCVWGSTRS